MATVSRGHGRDPGPSAAGPVGPGRWPTSAFRRSVFWHRCCRAVPLGFVVRRGATPSAAGKPRLPVGAGGRLRRRSLAARGRPRRRVRCAGGPRSSGPEDPTSRPRAHPGELCGGRRRCEHGADPGSTTRCAHPAARRRYDQRCPAVPASGIRAPHQWELPARTTPRSCCLGCGPGLPVTGAPVGAGRVDATDVVTAAGSTIRTNLGRAVGRPRPVDAPVASTVLNGLSGSGGHGCPPSGQRSRPQLCHLAELRPAARR